MNFSDLKLRLKAHLKERVRSGATTERGLARATGVSQPHMHNVLNGKRALSSETADVILRKLHLNLADFMRED